MLTMNFSKVFGAYFWNQLNKVVEFAIVFITSIVIARGLGPNNYGVYAAVNSFAGLFILFASFGFEQIINAQIPKFIVSGQFGESLYILKKLMIFRLLTLCVSYVLLNMFAEVISVAMHMEGMTLYLQLIAFYVVLTGSSSLLFYMLIAQLKMKQIAIVNISSKALKLIFSFILLRLGFSISGLILLAIGLSLFELAFYYIFLKKTYTAPSIKVDLNPYKSLGANFWIISIVNYFLERQIDIIILGLFAVPASQIAFYGLSATLTTTISVLTISGLGGVSLTAFSSIHEEKGELALGKSWEMLVKFTTLMSVPLTVFTIIFAEQIILYVYSTKYLPAAHFLRWISIYMLFSRIMGGGANITALYASHREKTALNIRIGFGAINVIMDIVLIKYMGVLGAVLATGTSLLCANFIEYLFLKKTLNVKLPALSALKVVCASVVSGFICTWLPITNILSIFLAGILFVCIFLVVAYFIKPLENEDSRYAKNLPQPFNYVIIKLIKV